MGRADGYIEASATPYSLPPGAAPEAAQNPNRCLFDLSPQSLRCEMNGAKRNISIRLPKTDF